MKLQHELGMRNPLRHPAHEALLNVYYTTSRLKKRAAEFFRDYGLTDVQFNVMMLLEHQTEPDQGLTQVDLSRMMLVNRANITSLIDRMERGGLVERRPVPGDRRYNTVCLTADGRRRLQDVEEAYTRQIRSVMGAVSRSELDELIGLLERIRAGLSEGE